MVYTCTHSYIIYPMQVYYNFLLFLLNMTCIRLKSDLHNGTLPEVSEFIGSGGTGPLAVTVSPGAVAVNAHNCWAPIWGPLLGLHSGSLDEGGHRVSRFVLSFSTVSHSSSFIPSPSPFLPLLLSFSSFSLCPRLPFVRVFAPHYEAPALVEFAADFLPGAGFLAQVWRDKTSMG